MSPLDKYPRDELHHGCRICGYWEGTFIGPEGGEWAFCCEHRLKWMEGADRVPVDRATQAKERARYQRLCERYGVDTFQDADDPFREAT